MKRLYSLLIAISIIANIYGQAPAGFNYQAVARNATGQLITNTQITFQIAILKGSISGTAIYIETFTPTTNNFGLVTLNIGNGTIVSGTFADIDWGADIYFIKVWLNNTEMGTTQLLSVPYALHAKTAENLSGVIDITSSQVSDFLTSVTNNPSVLVNTAKKTYPTVDSVKLAGIEAGAELNVNADWNATSGDAQILNKPVLSQTAVSGSYYDLIDRPLNIDEDKTDDVDLINDQIIAGKKIFSDTVESKTQALFALLTVNGSAAIGTENPEKSAILDVNSTSQGFLPPRMTYSQKLSITNPVAGLIIWCNNCGATGELQVFNGKTWTNFAGVNSSSALPLVSMTKEISSINFNNALSGGILINDGGSEIINLGVCWSTISNPTIEDNSTTDSVQISQFSSLITGLSPGTKYFVRAYATNINGTAYANEISFITSTDTTIVTDFDGNIYNTIEIGTQIWMANNLKTTKYSDNSVIRFMPDGLDWKGLTLPGYCWYNNQEVNKDTYGALYNGYAVNTGKLCPNGWHVPSTAEWNILIEYLGGSTVAGGKLKSVGYNYWFDPNTGASNEVSFSALPGGYRNYFSSFAFINYYGCWWTTSDVITLRTSFEEVYINSGDVFIYYKNNLNGFSVRCLKDY